MKTVGLITYDHFHLKSEQVMQNLVLKQHFDFRVFAIPFKPRKSREVVFSHRPDQETGAHPYEIAKQFGFPYKNCVDDRDIDGACDVYLVLGAGILSGDFVRGKKIVNCHPGIIPSSRGLDSFKWAILENKPIGITLHYIDEQVDAGQVISVLETHVYKSDSLESLARRHYELEINALSNFDWHMSNARNDFNSIACDEAKMRMPRATERKMIEMFPEYKQARVT